MTTSIIGLFENSNIASKVLGELTKAGFKKDAVEIIEKVAASKITSRLVEAGYEKDKRVLKNRWQPWGLTGATN
jgi:hypothetical protein